MSIEAKLNSKNNGSLFKGRTWNSIFGYLAGNNDPETWIEPVYTDIFGLRVDHYNLCGYGNHREYRNKIPKELNSFIEEHLSHLIEG